MSAMPRPPGASESLLSAQRFGAAVVLPASAILLLVLFVDVPLQNWINVHHSLALADVLDQVYFFGSPGAPVVIGAILYGIGILVARERLRRLAKRIVLSCLLAGAIVLVVKPVVGRQEAVFHPEEAAENGWQKRWGRFPSGNAAVAFAMAAALAVEGPGLALIAYPVATLVGIQRLEFGAHVPSDVLAGAWLALAAAWYLARRERRRAPPSAADRSAPEPPPSAGRVALALGVLAMPIFALHLGAWRFFDPDEGRFVEIAWEMIVRGDYVTPTLNFVPYFEKPALFYWLVAATFRMFGLHEWAARLVPAACALSTAWVAFVLGRRMFGSRAGAWSAMILVTTLMWAAMGRLVILDILLSTTMAAAFALWWLGRSAPGSRAWAYDVSFWLAIALGVLTKGPVAAVLVCGSIGVYALVTGEWRQVFRRSLVLTFPVAVLAAAPWFVLVAERNPGFNMFFWYGQHIGRYLGLKGHDEHEKSVFFFAGMLPLLLLPWSALMPGAVVSGLRRLWPPSTERRRAFAYLVCGIVLIPAFFSLSASKLPQYILPVLPLGAVALAGWLDAAAREPARAWGPALWRSPLGSGAILAVAVAVIGCGASLVLAPRQLRVVEDVGPGRAYMTAAVCAAWALALVIAARRRSTARLLSGIAGGAIALMVWLAVLALDLAPNHYVASLVAYIRPGLDAGGTLIASDSYLPTLGFYTGGRVVVNGSPGETEFGFTQIDPVERRRWWTEGTNDLRERLASAQPVYVMVANHAAAREVLPLLGPGVAEITWNWRRSIVGNAAAQTLTPPLPGGYLGSRPPSWRPPGGALGR
jgi:4-amino-4-deoxy-L-arabinose transferase-like glycosyltransferase/membrane-associated phospholipid phosphatase